MIDACVIKLGGSLLDLPDLVQRFEAFRVAFVTGPVLLVVGGAESAELVRTFDRQFKLGEERGHWLAVRAMQFNAHVVAAVLPGAVIVRDEMEARAAWQRGQLAVVEPVAWLEKEEAAGFGVPHRWTFTSDSIAAHIATRIQAAKLILLKSALPAPGRGDCGPSCAAGLGIVDADFPLAAKDVPAIELINLRHEALAIAAPATATAAAPATATAGVRCVLR